MQPLLPRLAALSRLTHLSAPAPYTTGDRDDGVLYGVQHVALSAQLRELQLTDLAGTEGQERLASALGRMSALTQLDIGVQSWMAVCRCRQRCSSCMWMLSPALSRWCS